MKTKWIKVLGGFSLVAAFSVMNLGCPAKAPVEEPAASEYTEEETEAMGSGMTGEAAPEEATAPAEEKTE